MSEATAADVACGGGVLLGFKGGLGIMFGLAGICLFSHWAHEHDDDSDNDNDNDDRRQLRRPAVARSG